MRKRENEGDGIVHSIWKQMVNIKEAGDLGAIPGPATNFAGVAQWLEQNLHKVEVVGPIPTTGT